MPKRIETREAWIKTPFNVDRFLLLGRLGYSWRVQALAALKILEAAALDCKTRDMDTPEVREALDVLELYCRPEWRATGFRNPLKGHKEFASAGEGQQHMLRV